MTAQVVGPLQRQTINPGSTDWSQTVTFTQFDPSLGTLQGIDVGLTADVAGGVSIESLESAPSTVNASLNSYIDAISPSGVLLANASADGLAAANLLAYGGSTDDVGDSSTTLALSGTGTTYAGWRSGSSDLGNFIGTGSVPLSVADYTRLDVSGPANLQLASHAGSASVVTLQYDYTPSDAGGSGSDDFFGGVTINAALADLSVPYLPYGVVTGAVQTFTFADSTTGWSKTVPVAEFGPALGTLEGVNLSLSGDIQASVSAQNEEATATYIDTAQTATVALGSSLSVAPSLSDYMLLAGGAARTDLGLSGTDSATTQLTDPVQLAAFVGQGTVALPISATGTSRLDGPGNMLATLLAQAGATVTVSYTYLPVGVTADSVVWWNLGGGDWSDGSKWTTWTAPPQSTDDVAITQAGTYTITLDSAQTIHSLVVDSPDATVVLDAGLTATGNIILDAGTIVFSGGTLTADALTMNGGTITGHTVDIHLANRSASDLGTGTIVADSVNITSGSAFAGSVTAAAPGSVAPATGVVDLASNPSSFLVAGGIGSLNSPTGGALFGGGDLMPSGGSGGPLLYAYASGHAFLGGSTSPTATDGSGSNSSLVDAGAILPTAGLTIHPPPVVVGGSSDPLQATTTAGFGWGLDPWSGGGGLGWFQHLSSG